MKEPTQQAWNKYRRVVFGRHNIDEKKERIAALLNINHGQLPAYRLSGNVKKRALKGASKFVNDAKKAVKEIAVDAKRAIRRLSKMFLDLDKELSDAQTSGGGASGAGAEVGLGLGPKLELLLEQRLNLDGNLDLNPAVSLGLERQNAQVGPLRRIGNRLYDYQKMDSTIK